MKKVISYVLWGQEGRYWAGLPYILVTNSVIYSEFCSRFYIHSNSTQAPLFKMLEKAQALFPDLVKIELITKRYQGTKLTTWRMKPLWENDVEVLLCRDVDHITNGLERKAVEFFIRHCSKGLHSIRSYHLHSAPFLAGLCGFKPQQLKEKVRRLAPTFDDYLTWGTKHVTYCKRDWIWGCDQALLRDFFRYLNLYPETIDCPQFTAPNKVVGYNPLLIETNKYENIFVENCNMDALKLSNSFAPGFTGAPCNPTSDQTREMMKLVDNEMVKTVSEYV